MEAFPVSGAPLRRALVMPASLSLRRCPSCRRADHERRPRVPVVPATPERRPLPARSCSGGCAASSARSWGPPSGDAPVGGTVGHAGRAAGRWLSCGASRERGDDELGVVTDEPSRAEPRVLPGRPTDARPGTSVRLPRRCPTRPRRRLGRRARSSRCGSPSPTPTADTSTGALSSRWTSRPSAKRARPRTSTPARREGGQGAADHDVAAGLHAARQPGVRGLRHQAEPGEPLRTGSRPRDPAGECGGLWS